MNRHPEWCTQDTRCTAAHVTGGEHASPPEIWETDYGRIIGTRYQTGSGTRAGHGWLEIRVVVTLPAAEAAAQDLARQLIAGTYQAVAHLLGQQPANGEKAAPQADVLITRGLPGCGKTTLARRWVAAAPGRARISRDDLRAMLHHGPRGEQTEKQVTDAAHAAAKILLRQGISVIFDETNLPEAHYQQLLDLAREEAANPVTVDLRHVPLAVCLRRNASRHGAARVPERIIRAMHAQHVTPTLKGHLR
ncbi:hypothetical protein Rhe02_98660 [Rhizocola hellebori]|uniref:ATP-binding protein n=1 Tax=Rhizocola hellebori TaxID=1392758 RepID=A0A8J3VLY2_9ACTN|nr:AAA family ATPase [Rhizocola hellebori]GIH11799.1 hypothetical protein Rhe02_98660 [Rhizocola hellebori]